MKTLSVLLFPGAYGGLVLGRAEQVVFLVLADPSTFCFAEERFHHIALGLCKQ